MDNYKQNILKRLRKRLEEKQHWLEHNSTNAFISDHEFIKVQTEVDVLMWAMMVVHEG